MSRVLQEAQLTTRSARSRLPAGIHWRTLDVSTHLGYRKGVRAGAWIVRWRQKDGRYQQERLAVADDLIEADGSETLTFHQAQSLARSTVARRREEAARLAAGPVVSVRTATENYILDREAREVERGAPSLKRDARSRLKRHVLGDPLADLTLHDLDADALADWRRRLAARGLARSTQQRTINDLKAALNMAATRHRKAAPANLAFAIRDGLRAAGHPSGTVTRADHVLDDEEVRLVLDAARRIDRSEGWDGDLHRLILVLAATGARFSQLARMQVRDVQPRRLLVPVSAKGRGAKARTHCPVPVDLGVIDALQPVTSDRPGQAALFEYWRHRQTAPDSWERTRRDIWRSASELTRPFSRIVADAGLPLSLTPYCLRHSAIVRCLRNGLPVRLVAQLHDTSIAMIERHYSAHIVEALDELAAQAALRLLPDAAE